MVLKSKVPKIALPAAPRSRTGRVSKVTPKLKDILVNDSKKRQARKAKATKLAAASIIATRPKPVRDNNILLGEVQPFEPPLPTGDPSTDQKQYLITRGSWLRRAVLLCTGDDLGELTPSNETGLKKWEGIWTAITSGTKVSPDGSESQLKPAPKAKVIFGLDLRNFSATTTSYTKPVAKPSQPQSLNSTSPPSTKKRGADAVSNTPQGHSQSPNKHARTYLQRDKTRYALHDAAGPSSEHRDPRGNRSFPSQGGSDSLIGSRGEETENGDELDDDEDAKMNREARRGGQEDKDKDEDDDGDDDDDEDEDEGEGAGEGEGEGEDGGEGWDEPPVEPQNPNKPRLRSFYPSELRRLIKAVSEEVVTRLIAEGTYMDEIRPLDNEDEGQDTSMVRIAREVWTSESTRRHLPYRLQVIHIKYFNGRVTSWRARYKERALILLRPVIDPSAGKKHTRKRVQSLLPDAFHSKNEDEELGSFKSKRVVSLVRIAVYMHVKDKGVLHDECFKPTPLGLIALAVTMGYHIIRLFESGTYQPRSLRASEQAGTFRRYYKLLLDMQASCPVRTLNLQQKIHTRCKAALPATVLRADSTPPPKKNWGPDSERAYSPRNDIESDDEEGNDLPPSGSDNVGQKGVESANDQDE